MANVFLRTQKKNTPRFHTGSYSFTPPNWKGPGPWLIRPDFSRSHYPGLPSHRDQNHLLQMFGNLEKMPPTFLGNQFTLMGPHPFLGWFLKNWMRNPIFTWEIVGNHHWHLYYIQHLCFFGGKSGPRSIACSTPPNQIPVHQGLSY